MPIYRQDADGRFQPFELGRPNQEKELEDWVETSPQVLLDEPLAVIGRQVTTSFGKGLDLLAVDRAGAAVIIELKKGMAPREIIAQALEYSAWVDSLATDDLDVVASNYARAKGLEAEGVLGLYQEAFDPGDEEDEDSSGDQVTFNARQRVVIVAEDFPGEMEQTIRYLRARLGLDLSAVKIGVHELSGEKLLETEVVVGRERVGTTKTTGSTSSSMESHEETMARVSSEFLAAQVSGLEEWIGQQDAALKVQHNTRSGHSVYAGARHLGVYYFAENWIHFSLRGRIPGDGEAMNALSSPPTHLDDRRIAGNIKTPDDLEIYKKQLRARL